MTTSRRTILNWLFTTQTSHDVWFHVLAPFNKYGVFAALETLMYSPLSVPLVTTTYCELEIAPMEVFVAGVIPRAPPDAYVVLLRETHAGGGEGGDGGVGGGGLGGGLAGALTQATVMKGSLDVELHVPAGVG